MRPICKNQYALDGMQKFPNMLSATPPFQD